MENTMNENLKYNVIECEMRNLFSYHYNNVENNKNLNLNLKELNDIKRFECELHALNHYFRPFTYYYGQKIDRFVDEINKISFYLNGVKHDILHYPNRCKFWNKFSRIQTEFPKLTTFESHEKFKEIQTTFKKEFALIHEINFLKQLQIKIFSKHELIGDFKSGYYFCYNQQSKHESRNEWDTCFSRLIHLENYNSKNVINYDILNINENNLCFFKLENNKIDVLAGKINEQLFGVYIESPKEIVKPEINIILLGESGVGKSTWINAFYNYTTYQTLAEAEKQSVPSSLIGSKFSYTDDNFENHEIRLGSDENESFIEGQSSTQTAKAYTFELNGKIVRIIDTPGLCSQYYFLI